MRIRTGIIVATSALAAVAPFAAAHEATGPAERTSATGGQSLTGVLRLTHADDAARRRAIWRGTLTTSRRTYTVANPGRLEGLADRRVRLTAKVLRGGRIIVDPTSVRVTGAVAPTRRLTRSRLVAEMARAGRRPSSARRQMLIGGARRVAVLRVNFSDDAGVPFTPAQIQTALFSSDPQSMTTYFQQVSGGRTSFSGNVFGPYTLSVPSVGCDPEAWGDLARAQAILAGVDLSTYQHIAYLWPTQCNNVSFGIQPPLPGPSANDIGEVWLDGTIDLHVAAHEIGHNLGLSHGYSLDCPDATNGRVSLRHPGEGAACAEREYEDPFGVMGGFDAVDPADFTYELGARQRHQLGWLDDSQVQTVSANGDFTLAPLESPGGVKELRIDHCSPLTGAPESFSVEFRRPLGFDAGLRPVVEGLYLRVARGSEPQGGFSYGTQPRLIDTTPLTATYLDAALVAGQSFVDGRDGLTISALSLGPAGATVRVAFGPDAVAPAAPAVSLAPTSEVAAGTPARIADIAKRTPPAVRLTWQPTTECRGPASSYRILRDGAAIGTVATPGFTDTGLATSVPGSLLNYSVEAIDATGNASAPSTPVSTLAPDVVAPTTPSALTVSRSGTARRLSWGQSTDNAAGLRYGVYRDGALLEETTGTSITDRQEKRDGTRLEYQVVAIDATGNVSAPTPVVAITIGGTSSATRRVVTFSLRKRGPVKLVISRGARQIGTLRRVGKAGRNRVVLPTSVVRDPGRYTVKVIQRGRPPIIVSVRV